MTSFIKKNVPVGQVDFISKAEALYGKGNFDYSKVVYTGRYNRVNIHCHHCNADFSEKPFSHLAGKGCLLCGACEKERNLSISNEGFIAKAKQVHGDVFDYSNTVYKGFDKPVNVHCKACKQDFERIAQAFTQGRGCTHCEKTQELKKLYRLEVENDSSTEKANDQINGDQEHKIKQEAMLQRAQKCHGTEKYDYREAVYINNNSKLKIFCNACKSFFHVRAINHFNGTGCDLCKAKEKKKKPSIQMFGRKAFTQEDYIKRAEMVHGVGVFDYTDSVFTKTSENIKFKCLTCLSVIERNANYHINTTKKGCPICREVNSKNQYLEDK